MKIHLIATILVIAGGLFWAVSSSEWCFIALSIGLVWITEAFNTAIERLCDLYDTRINEHIRIIKDISAGAVLLACTVAIIIGGFVFIPHLFL